jgi:MFS family permease
MAEAPSFVRRIGALPRAAWVICGGMFLIKLGNFLNVFLVLYLTASGYGPALAGLALGAVGIGNFLGNVVGGAVADRVGRRATIVVSMFGYGLSVAFVPFTGNIWLIMGMVSVVGFFAQLYRPAAGAMLVDVLPADQRVLGFAVLRLAINVGMAIGPAVGGLVSEYSYTWIFIGEAVASLTFGVLALVALTETRPVEADASEDAGATQPDAARARPANGYRAVARDRPYLFFLAAMVAATFVYSQAVVTLPLHVTDAGFSNAFYGLLLSVNALVIVFLELPLTRFTERRAPLRVIAFGLVVLGVGFGLTGLSHTEALLLGTVLLWTVAEMIYTPVAAAYPGQVAPAQLRGRYQGAEALAHTLGQVLGPVVGGTLYGLSSGLHWTVCAVVGAAGAGLVLLARPPAPVTAEPSPAPSSVAS